MFMEAISSEYCHIILVFGTEDKTQSLEDFPICTSFQSNIVTFAFSRISNTLLPGILAQSITVKKADVNLTLSLFK
jgi:hypothetical protein